MQRWFYFAPNPLGVLSKILNCLQKQLQHYMIDKILTVECSDFYKTFCVCGYQTITQLGKGNIPCTYHIDELDESQPKGDLYLLSHILHWPNELVVPAEEITDQALFLLRAPT